jgi:hypothetical protein
VTVPERDSRTETTREPAMATAKAEVRVVATVAVVVAAGVMVEVTAGVDEQRLRIATEPGGGPGRPLFASVLRSSRTPR